MATKTQTKPTAIPLADCERRLIASLIDPKTSAKTRTIAEREHIDFDMFSSSELATDFRAILVHGAEAFRGVFLGDSASLYSTAQEDLITSDCRRIRRAWKKRVAERDRTLDEFTTPERDEDDEDCLFRNRWLRRGACGMIVSSSGVGKSSFTMQAAVHWARAQEMLGVMPIKKLKIGIIQSEDDEFDVPNFRDKIRIGLRTELKWTDDNIAEAESRVTFVAWDGSTGSKFVEFVRNKQLVHHFDLIIVNPLHAFFGGDLKNADEVSKFLRNGIDRLIKDEETKCAIVFVHHTGKPSKEKLAEGDFFAGYLGSGSAELINYPRVALTLTPWKDGKVPGVFNLIGTKHGDKLAWKDKDGKPTNKRVVCYANRLERHRRDGCIYWLAPDLDDMEEIETTANKVAAVNKDGIYKRAAIALAEIFKRTKVTGPATWVEKKCKGVPFSRSERKGGLQLIACNPATFGLVEMTDGREKYYAADPNAAPTTETNADETDLGF